MEIAELTTESVTPSEFARFRQPKVVVRWLAIVVALAGWWVSFQLVRVSAGAASANPFMTLVCGEADVGCASVLTSPEAYITFGTAPGSPRVPSATLGMAYFAFVAVWYLFVGPPTRSGRGWHWLIAVVVVLGVCNSIWYIRVMAFELHAWCGGCLVAHGLNGGLLVLTLLSYPWRGAAEARAPHPTTRLALSAATAGGLVLVVHFSLAFVVVAGTLLKHHGEQYAAVLNDPAYVAWDLGRQPEVEIPLYDDEFFTGSPDARNTLIVYSDFQCPACTTLHEALKSVVEKYGDRLRVAYRYYPQDPECNGNPKYRVGGHASGCRAARAAEAVRQIGELGDYARVRDLLFARHNELPKHPFAQQSDDERGLLADWAVELGVDRAAFVEAYESPAVVERIRADIELAEKLGIDAMPVVFLNGKRVRGWSQMRIWDALLGE